MRKILSSAWFKISMAVMFLVISTTGEVSAARQPTSIGRNPVRESVLAQESPVCSELGVARTFSASFDKVFAASLAVLEEKEEPTALDDPVRGLINTGSVSVDNQRLRQIVAEEFLEFLGDRDGRYLLSFCLETVSDQSTTVIVTPLIIMDLLVQSFLGGRPVASNGTLETEHLDAIAEKLGGPIPQTPRAFQDCCELESNILSANMQINQADHNSGTLANSTTQSETSLAVFGSTIVMGWNDSSEFATAGFGLTSFTGFGFSTDGGSTFTDAGLLAPTPGFVSLGDPALAVDRMGNFYFASLTVDNIFTNTGSHIAVAQSTSTSPSVTFGTPVLIPGLLPFGFQDKELIAVDASGSPFDGRVYVAWTEFGSTNDTTILLAGSTSTAPLAFGTPIALSPADALNQGAMPAVGPNGELYVVWGRFVLGAGGITAESIRLLRSNDGGVTFINPDPADANPNKIVAGPTPTPGLMTTGGPFERISRTRGFPYIAVDTTPGSSPTRGNVYIVFQADPDGAGADLSDIFFTRSTDGGATWSAPVSINAGAAVTTNPDTTTNDNWQPSIAVSPGSGEIAVTFYDRRNDTTSADGDPPNTKIALFRSISRDGGLTWSNEQVSDVAFTPSNGVFDPLVVDTYMGDYNYTVADASNFYMAWGDTRNLCTPPPATPNPCSPVGRGDQDVFYAQDSILSDLSITKADSPDPVTAGQTLTYTLAVTNSGPSATTAVTVTDTLPPGVTFVSATASPGTCMEAASVVTCELGNLANGASATIIIEVTVDSAAACGSSLPNSAVVAGNVSDPNSGDNSASADTTVTCPAGIDIRPEEFPNRIRIGGGDDNGPRLVHVAILSNSSFDAPNEVDRKSLTFGHSGNEKSLHKQGKDCWKKDVNKDGLLDLVCNFVIRKTGFQPSDTVGILKGKLLDGTSFEAQDSVVIVVGGNDDDLLLLE